MSNLIPPRLRALNASGSPIAGAKLNFYAAGTTDRKNTYATEAARAAGTPANANPVVADGNGWFGEIYLATDGDYKVVFTDANDNTIWTVDNMSAAQVATSSLNTRIKQIASNPLDYGAVGDGVADESAAVQAAIDWASTNGTNVVNLLGLTYRCDSTLTIPTGTVIIGRDALLDFSQCDDDSYITLTGAWAAGEDALTANADFGDTTLGLTSGSGAGVGSLYHLSDGQNYISYRAGELVQFASYAAPTATLCAPVAHDYLVASGAYARKITSVARVTMRDLRIKGSESPAGTNVRVIDARLCSKLLIENVQIFNFDVAGVLLSGCSDVRLNHCTFRDASVAGVGVMVVGANSAVRLDDCRFERLKVGVGSGEATFAPTSLSSAHGQTRGLRLTNVAYLGCDTDVSLSEEVVSVAIDGYKSEGATTGGVVCKSPIVLGHEFHVGQGVVSFTPTAPNKTGRNYHVLLDKIRCYVDKLIFNGAAVTGGAGRIETIHVSDVLIYGAEKEILYTPNAVGATGGAVTEFTIMNFRVAHIDIAGNATGNVLDNVNLVNGHVKTGASADSCMTLAYITTLRMAHLYLLGDGTNTELGIYMSTVTAWTLTDSQLSGYTDGSARWAIESLSTETFTISGCTIYNAATDGGGVYCTGSGMYWCKITDNTIYALDQEAIYIGESSSASEVHITDNACTGRATGTAAVVHVAAGCTGLVVSGNTISSTASVVGLLLSGGVASAFDGCQIANNTIVTLGHGISATGLDHTTISGNNITTSTNRGVSSTTALNTNIVGNIFHDCSYGIYDDSAVNCWADGNVFNNTGTRNIYGTFGSPVLIEWREPMTSAGQTSNGGTMGYGEYTIPSELIVAGNVFRIHAVNVSKIYGAGPSTVKVALTIDGTDVITSLGLAVPLNDAYVAVIDAVLRVVNTTTIEVSGMIIDGSAIPAPDYQIDVAPPDASLFSVPATVAGDVTLAFKYYATVTDAANIGRLPHFTLSMDPPAADLKQ